MPLLAPSQKLFKEESSTFTVPLNGSQRVAIALDIGQEGFCRTKVQVISRRTGKWLRSSVIQKVIILFPSFLLPLFYEREYQTTIRYPVFSLIILLPAINRTDTSLPSINALSKTYHVSRDTVFKAFADLRERKLIDSTPGKGYYVTNRKEKIFLLLDDILLSRIPYIIVLSRNFLCHTRQISGFINIMNIFLIPFYARPQEGIIIMW